MSALIHENDTRTNVQNESVIDLLDAAPLVHQRHLSVGKTKLHHRVSAECLSAADLTSCALTGRNDVEISQTTALGGG